MRHTAFEGVQVRGRARKVGNGGGEVCLSHAIAHGPWLWFFSISSELKVELCVRVLDQPLTAAPPPGIIRGGEQLEPPFKEIA